MDFLELGSFKNLKLIIGSVLIKRSESILQSSFQFKWQVTKAEEIAKHTLNRKNSIKSINFKTVDRRWWGKYVSVVVAVGSEGGGIPFF